MTQSNMSDWIGIGAALALRPLPRYKIIHPASDFGVFPGAALGVDDVWGLRRDLIHLFYFLVTGNVKEEMKWKPRL